MFRIIFTSKLMLLVIMSDSKDNHYFVIYEFLSEIRNWIITIGKYSTICDTFVKYYHSYYVVYADRILLQRFLLHFS